MKKLILLTIFALSTFRIVSGQCNALYSFGAYFETVTFINQSNVPNAHYWWNFGDGTGSNYFNPVHKFPENGHYLVTLYATDTISNCTDFYEYELNITKYSVDSCQPTIQDSVWTDTSGDTHIHVIDNSMNCGGYSYNYDFGYAHNFPPNVGMAPYWQTIPFLLVTRVQYYTYDTINGYQIKREAYRTLPYNFPRENNYNDCSANFEFKVISETPLGQTFLFTAMNKTATYYEWWAQSAMQSNSDTVSLYWPFQQNDIKTVQLSITGSGGCTDTVVQDILIRADVETTIGIESLNDQIEYEIYPNPFNEQSLLTFPPIAQETFLEIFNAHGQLVRIIKNVESGQVIINRNGLPSGLYYFAIKTKDKIMAAGKLMITP